jgi:single-stranded-DNA-specific exonuclease
MQKNWNVKKPDIGLQKEISRQLDIHPLLAQLLINRGILTAQAAARFLACDTNGLYDPFLLKDMPEAVSRIRKAIKKNQRITVWGDYDVDGLTAVALLKSVLMSMGGRVEHYIPHRIDEGYGLNLDGVRKISKDKAGLLITVDCGINSNREIEFLNKQGIDAIITDHHQPINDNLPPAFCIINPLQAGCGYPFKYLAGCGLAFKLSQALTGEDLFEHLDLAALGTVSDIVPMTDENRIIVKHGLAGLSKTGKVGLVKLIEKTGLSDKDITTMHAAFMLGPRLNATGRMGSSEDSLKLLLTDSSDEAGALASRLNENNRLRQQIEAKILQEALDKIDKEVNFKHHRVIVLYKDDWHPGVTGIVASRIVERFYRPAILLSSTQDGLAKGSGRSIDNFHLFDALANCESFLERFGGHSKACGLSLDAGRIDDFRRAINEYAFAVIDTERLMPDIEIDAQIPISLLSEGLITQMQALSPFGPQNTKPVFATKAVSLKGRPQVLGRNTLKMWVSDGDITCEAVGFNMADAMAGDDIPSVIDIVYTAGLNEWQGESTIELHLKDLRPSCVTVPL